MRKYLAYLLILIPTLALAGMIEITDDDPYQLLEFSNCAPDSIDSLRVAVMIDPDSGYWEMPHVLTDSIHFEVFGYIAPDRDSGDNLIPGHYAGEYWFYTISILPNGDQILSEDTTHVSVDYTIAGGCGGLFSVDF